MKSLLVPVALALLGSPAEEEVVKRWRARLAEMDRLEQNSGVSFSEGSWGELGRVAFVFEQVGRGRRRLLDASDKELVYRAVLGQRPEEIEENLPAIINYLKIGLEAKALLPLAQSREPVFGARPGLETLARISTQVAEFRYQQFLRLQSGRIDPPHVLTKANLGRLGEASTLRELEGAFRQGEKEYVRQSDLAALSVMGSVMALSVAAAVAIFRRKAPPPGYGRMPGT